MNHLSALDIPASAIACPNPFRFLSKAELGKIPVLGWIIRNIYLTVDRGSARARSESLVKMTNALNEGSSILIYPEGTRNRGGSVPERFFDGAFRLALSSGKPLAMLCLVNSHERSHGSKFSLQPGVLRYHWLPVIEPADFEHLDVSALRELALERMQTKIKELQAND